MNITVVSDFICPYCYIAEKHLVLAIEACDYKDQVQVEYRSFQLYPDLDPDEPISLFEAMKKIKNLSYEHVEMLFHRLDDIADELGLVFNFHDMKYTNTFRTHRVFQYAKEKGKGIEFFNHIFKAFFTDGQIISDTDVILAATGDLGLDTRRVLDIIADEEKYKDQVLRDIAKTIAIPVYSVPFIIFDDKYGIYGGRSVDQILSTMDMVYQGTIDEERNKKGSSIRFIDNKKEEDQDGGQLGNFYKA